MVQYNELSLNPKQVSQYLGKVVEVNWPAADESLGGNRLSRPDSAGYQAGI